eukprot:comp22485_c0_seq1/m.33915 comp22485_c0_seq1/g.33915  ORF comp22485_c0_seq1/g.33915 comp22485_c0_seq1/m.33915 type:complete len:1183 (-) comp22485_c0_seq1:540-4088(-)
MSRPFERLQEDLEDRISEDPISYSKLREGGDSTVAPVADDAVHLDGTIRTVHLKDMYKNEESNFCSNYISTAKYTVWTFLPKFLYEQFSRYANLFFLFVILVQQVPGVSPTGRWTTLIPLLVVLTATAVKEILEDLKRHKSDSDVNGRAVRVLKDGAFQTVRWEQVRVGDIVRVVNDQFFPADLVLLASSEPQGICYVETSNLDGETNLKIRQGSQLTKDLKTVGDLRFLEGTLKVEPPNSRLYKFEGVFMRRTDDGIHQIPLGADQIVLRGAQLRNTQWVYGVAVYTGHDSKLLQSASAAPIKRSNLERITNFQILFLFAALILLALLSTIGSLIWRKNNQDTHWYLGFEFEGPENFFRTFLTFIILYNNLIPISLYVTLEVVKYIQALVFINNDLDMYHEESDTPALVRTSNLNEELGQIQYIFSDKTGTLTRNIMELRKMSIGGIIYGAMAGEMAPDGVPDEFKDNKGLLVADGFHDPSLLDNLTQNHPTAPVIRQFLTLLAVCHTVIPEVSKEDPGKIIYQAQSPDEGALVSAVKRLGFSFNVRTPKGVTINVLGTDETYEVLNVLEFTSTRKRMSVIVRTPQGTLLLMCKGADTAIMERLAPNQPFVDVTLKHLEQCAAQGLRTLCLAVAELDPVTYESWAKGYEEALTSMTDRENKVSAACDKIEKDMFLLGATAIEDKLQDKVPETIANLLEAGIKLWMLTGDKQETAINIGYSCRLFNEQMNIMVLNKKTKYDTMQWLDSTVRKVRQIDERERKSTGLALVIDGASLAFCLEDDLRGEFLEISLVCKAVVCCRVSPAQKAEVVELVKNRCGAITLAIGDGANDVGMIQAAHVGVGISGQEGLQAARASDYAIAQFKYLQKLLLVHGQWSYRRLSKLVLYSFYKNIALYIIQFWFAMVNGFSGMILFDEWMLAFYNVSFTLMQPLVIGIFDRTVSARTLMKAPQLYRAGIENKYFNVMVFWQWTLNAIFHSALIFWACFAAFADGATFGNGQTSDLWLLGLVVYTAVFLTATLKAALIYDSWVVWSHVSIWGSIVIYFLFLFIYCSLWPHVGWTVAVNIYMVNYQMFRTPVFWLTIVVVPIMACARDYLWKAYQRTVRPQDYHIIQELEKLEKDPSLFRQTDPFRKFVRKVPTIGSYVSRGYAFSQEERPVTDRAHLGQADIIRQYDTTQEKPVG